MSLPKQADLVRELVAREGFPAFVRHFWTYAEPGCAFIDSYYMQQLCAFMQLTLDGDIKRWLVNMPPRMGKSTCISVLRHAYQWTRRPEYRFMIASHDDGLVIRDAQRVVDVITSPLYRACWPKVALRQPLALKRLLTSKGGKRVGTTLRAKGSTGWGANDQTVDDPNKAADSKSPVALENSRIWYTQTAANRIDGPPEDFVRGITMQRLHQNDLSGLALEMGYIPLIMPIGRKNSKGVWVDLLFPEQWKNTDILKLESEMGSPAAVSAQLCQDPMPEKGGYVDLQWILRYSDLPARPENMRWLQVWDLGFKGKKASHSRVAGILCAAHMGKIWVHDYTADHLNYPETRRRFLALQERETWARAGRIYIEDAANGPALIADLKDDAAHVYSRVIPFPPGKLSKEERFALQSDKIQSGRLHIRQGLDEVVNEVYRFPNASYDDLADDVAKALSTLDMNSLAGKKSVLQRVLRR